MRTERSARVLLAGGAVDVGAPSGGGGPATAPSELREVWYLLHGYGQLARRFLARFEGIAAPERLLVVPEALSRFYVRSGEPSDGPAGARTVGASWMTREDREAEIADYVRYLDRVLEEVEVHGPDRPSADGPRRGADLGVPSRTLLGFSQGAHTAVRWAVRGHIRTGRLILWGGGLPIDLPPDAAPRLRKFRVVLVRGANDPLRNPADEKRDEQWLTRVRIPFDVREHQGGHDIDAPLLAAITLE